MTVLWLSGEGCAKKLNSMKLWKSKQNLTAGF